MVNDYIQNELLVMWMCWMAMWMCWMAPEWTEPGRGWNTRRQRTCQETARGSTKVDEPQRVGHGITAATAKCMLYCVIASTWQL